MSSDDFKLSDEQKAALIETKDKKLINWDPLEGLESGLDKTINWFKENVKSLEKLS